MTKQNITNAIYKRRAVRSYKKQRISDDIIESLLDAAIHAPTAMHQEAWSFAIIQDRNLLKQISDISKTFLAQARQNPDSPFHAKSLDHFIDPDFDIFYNADTLIVIYGKTDSPFISADCWLAAENLMLTACDTGLGSCVIGLAVEALNGAEMRNILEIPNNLTAFAPIILGYPSAETPATSRKKAQIIFRK